MSGSTVHTPLYFNLSSPINECFADCPYVLDRPTCLLVDNTFCTWAYSPTFGQNKCLPQVDLGNDFTFPNTIPGGYACLGGYCGTYVYSAHFYGYPLLYFTETEFSYNPNFPQLSFVNVTRCTGNPSIFQSADIYISFRTYDCTKTPGYVTGKGSVYITYIRNPTCSSNFFVNTNNITLSPCQWYTPPSIGVTSNTTVELNTCQYSEMLDTMNTIYVTIGKAAGTPSEASLCQQTLPFVVLNGLRQRLFMDVELNLQVVNRYPL